ncbi:hypothetical protein R3P38DRAFT_2806856 [Favolaschia claudopus]|uniref:Uncharacterized protein n=1 Tax=Favolaschia claudopus TaxID=2862362 RepID=A0AAV9ZIX6_9AGAR
MSHFARDALATASNDVDFAQLLANLNLGLDEVAPNPRTPPAPAAPAHRPPPPVPPRKVQHGSTLVHPRVPQGQPVPGPGQTVPVMDPTRKPVRVTRGSLPTRGSLRVLRQKCRDGQAKLGRDRDQHLATTGIVRAPSAEVRQTLPSTREDPRVPPDGSTVLRGSQKSQPVPVPGRPSGTNPRPVLNLNHRRNFLSSPFLRLLLQGHSDKFIDIQ